MNYYLVILLAFIFMFVTVFTIALHEVCHLIIFKLQGYGILAVSLLCFTFTKKKTVLNFDKVMLGGVFLDLSSVDSDEKKLAFERNFKSNILITYSLGLITVFLLLVLCVLFRNCYFYTIFGAVLFTNLALFISSFYNYGDFDLFFKMGKYEAVSIAFIAYSEIFTGLKNEYVLKKITHCFNGVQIGEKESFILVDYYIDYCLFYGDDLNYDILGIIKSTYNTNRTVCNFLLEKFYLWTVLYSVEDRDVLGDEYSYYIKKILNKESVKKIELKLEIDWKLFRCFSEYNNFENLVFKKISNLY